MDIPEGILTVVADMSGAGKRTLVLDVLTEQYPEAVMLDQSRLAANVHSTPATYTGIMDEIRKVCAKASGVPASLFSFNSEGSWPVALTTKVWASLTRTGHRLYGECGLDLRHL